MSAALLKQNLLRFKRKFYINKIIRGTLILGISVGLILLIFSLLEGYFWFNSSVRTALFGLILVLLGAQAILGAVLPLMKLLNLTSGISDQQAAREIGTYFPEIDDKLLNYLQLSENKSVNNELINAALSQKTEELKIFSFPRAISFKVNLRYVYYFLGVAIIITLFSFSSPDFFKSSTHRLLNFNEEFEKPAPFKFTVLSELTAFVSDSYELKVRVEGNSMPPYVNLLDGDRPLRMNFEDGIASFTFPHVSREKTFQLEGAGYTSKEYTLNVYYRPEIRSLSLDIDYPAYTRLNDQTVQNTGSLIIPEGSQIQWNIDCEYTNEVWFISTNDSVAMSSNNDNEFVLKRSINQSQEYSISLNNEHTGNKNPIRYKLSVIEDQYPQIEARFLPDTSTFKSLFISGNIKDDYGFSRLNLHYKSSSSNDLRSIRIPIDYSQTSEQFYFRWNLDSLNLNSEDFLEVYAMVADNDAINGSKKAYSEKFYLRMPSEEEVEEMIAEKSDNSKNQMDKSLNQAEEINKELEDLESRLKNKKELDWQDEKLVEELMKDKEKLNEEIKKLQEKHQDLIKSQKEFNKQSKKLQEKAKKLQELISEVLDEETKKLYDELQELLKEKSNSEEVLDQLSKIKSKEQNLEKELERAIELFKRMQLETKMEQTAEKLDELSEKQENLAKEQETAKESDGSDIKDQQEKINEEFKKIEQELQEAQEMNEALKNPEPLESLDEEKEEIAQDLEELANDLQKDQENQKGEQSKKESRQQQQRRSQKMKNAGQKMKKMSDMMMSMQQSAEMMMMQENIDDLRDIVDNLVKLSFEQEEILTEIKEVQQIDPRFIELSQDQLQLINNAEVIEDSLMALASRVVQISSFVTREVGEVNRHLEETMKELRERNKGKASSHQQFAMTSMNNLALLLDDVLQQMQMSMAEAMGNPKQGEGKKQSLPSMSQLQKQLSEQIKQLKGGGKSGRELSEELAKLAAEQSELRRQLEQMQQGLEGQPQPGEEGEQGSQAGTKLKEAIEKMEENEVDLVNKRITQQLINRQEEILTRMLEAEQSMREQKESPKRESETAQEISRSVPPAIEEYLKAKKQEIELLKTIPLDLNPFYKKEVNDYFRRISVPQNDE